MGTLEKIGYTIAFIGSLATTNLIVTGIHQDSRIANSSQDVKKAISIERKLTDVNWMIQQPNYSQYLTDLNKKQTSLNNEYTELITKPGVKKEVEYQEKLSNHLEKSVFPGLIGMIPFVIGFTNFWFKKLGITEAYEYIYGK